MKFEKQTYTQTPNSLFVMMKEMDECELKVVLLICRYTFGYHRDEVKLSTRRIAEEIGMNTANVQKGADKAVERGLIEKVIDGNKTTIWRALVSDSEIESPVYQNLNRGVSDNESLSGVKESNKETINKKPDFIDFILQNDSKIQPILDAQNLFESTFGFGSLPWDSKKEWQKFGKWIAEIVKVDKEALKDYVTWRNGSGKYQAMSNNKIRQNPQMFMDTGWPTFLAHSSMYSSNSPIERNPAGI